MKIEIKNPSFIPNSIKPLYEYFNSIEDLPRWEYKGLIVEIDPTIDFKENDALIRWTDIYEGFNDKTIVKSLEEFLQNFRIKNA